MWAELRKGRTGQPEVDGLSLVNRREDLEYFFLLSPLSHLSVSRAKHRCVKRKVFPGDDCVRAATSFPTLGLKIRRQALRRWKWGLLKHFWSETDSEVHPRIARWQNHDLLLDNFCLKTWLSLIPGHAFAPVSLASLLSPKINCLHCERVKTTPRCRYSTAIDHTWESTSQ